MAKPELTKPEYKLGMPSSDGVKSWQKKMVPQSSDAARASQKNKGAPMSGDAAKSAQKGM